MLKNRCIFFQENIEREKPQKVANPTDSLKLALVAMEPMKQTAEFSEVENQLIKECTGYEATRRKNLKITSSVYIQICHTWSAQSEHFHSTHRVMEDEYVKTTSTP
jgi:hypothetical protein